MRSEKEIEVVVETDGENIDVQELTEFLYLFRAGYVFALTELPPSFLTRRWATPEEIRDFYNEFLQNESRHMSPMKVWNLAHRELFDDNLGIKDIHRENPLTIAFEGIAGALAIAVILSGGNFKLGPLKVKLPPLGMGINSLRAAFGKKPKPPRRKRPKK